MHKLIINILENKIIRLQLLLNHICKSGQTLLEYIKEQVEFAFWRPNIDERSQTYTVASTEAISWVDFG